MRQNRHDAALAKVIRQARARAGLSQTSVANKLGITFQQVQKYEGGANRIYFGRFLELCDVLGTTPEGMLAEVRNVPAQEEQTTAKADYQEAQRLVGLLHRLKPRTRRAVINLLTAFEDDEKL